MEETWTLPTIAPHYSDDMLQQRLNAINVLYTHCNIQDFKYIRSVEEEVFHQVTAHHMDYNEKIMQIVWNLKTNGDHLIQYEPSILVCLDDTHLAKNTEIETWFAAYCEKNEIKRKLLFEEAQLDTENEQTNNELFCRRCRSTNISIRQQQVRGADEAMTVFCSCNKCALRWKM